MIVYDVATKVLDTEIFPQLTWCLALHLLFCSVRRSLYNERKQRHTHTHTHTHIHTSPPYYCDGSLAECFQKRVELILEYNFTKSADTARQVSKKDFNNDAFLKLTEFFEIDWTPNGYLWNNFFVSQSILLRNKILPGRNSLIQIVNKVRQRLCRT